MMEINERQQAMLKAMGIELPWGQQNATPDTAIQSGKNDSWPEPQQTSPQPAAANQTRVAPPTPLRSPAIRQTASAASSTAMVQNSPETFSSSPATAAAMQETVPQDRDAIAIMPWEELEQAAMQCTACSLCKTRKNVVFGVGSPQAQWMIVGEAPGENEDRQGEPFVGQAGKLLGRMLTPLNLARRSAQTQEPIYIANVLKCRPPRNRNPEPAEMAICEPFLKRQIELILPKIIVAMGRFAVQTLLGRHEAIGRLRGQIHCYQGIPVIVTYHPAYLLRNPVDKRKSWADLCLAAQTLSQQ